MLKIRLVTFTADCTRERVRDRNELLQHVQQFQQLLVRRSADPNPGFGKFYPVFRFQSFPISNNNKLLFSKFMCTSVQTYEKLLQICCRINHRYQYFRFYVIFQFYSFLKNGITVNGSKHSKILYSLIVVFKVLSKYSEFLFF